MARAPTPQVFFLHLHKAGGTSFCATLAAMGILNRTVVNCNTYHYFHFDAAPQKALVFQTPQLEACAAAAAESHTHGARCCRWRQAALAANGIVFCEPGHWMGPCNRGFDSALDTCDNFEYATIMRPPIERIYSHMCQHGTNYSTVMRALEPGRTPPKRRNEWFAGTSAFDNYNVRALAGPLVWMLPAGSIDGEHLERAKKVLDRFRVVMTLDNLRKDTVQLGMLSHRSVSRLSTTGIVHASDYSCPVSSTTLANGFTPSERLQIEEANKWDLALYAYARKLAQKLTTLARRSRGVREAVTGVSTS